jgi:antibiotic biosynthesis monooxygenase (ABM) superfamily enzyme
MDTVTQPAAPATARPSAPTPSEPAAAAPALAAPSIHVRAVITWLAIFPLVAIGMIASAPLTENWHPIFRAMGLTMVVVPTAVYLVLPRLFAVHGFLAARRSSRR